MNSGTCTMQGRSFSSTAIVPGGMVERIITGIEAGSGPSAECRAPRSALPSLPRGVPTQMTAKSQHPMASPG